jgi:hypothetical protein
LLLNVQNTQKLINLFFPIRSTEELSFLGLDIGREGGENPARLST